MFLYLHPSVPLFSQIFKGLEICCYGPFTNMPTGKRTAESNTNLSPTSSPYGGSLRWVRYSRGYSLSLPPIRQNCA